MFRNLFIILCGLMMLVSKASADPTRLATRPFVEKVFENSEISGTLVVGLSRIAQNLSKELRISAEVPASWTNLCLTVTTVDGLYEARNDFVLPDDWAGGEVIFDYPTSYKDRLLEIGADRIGTLVQRGSCIGQSEQLALSGWRLSQASPDSFRLFVNAFQADEVFAYVGDGPEIKCTPLTEGNRAAFDMVCDLVLSENDESPIEIELIRVRSGHVEASTPLLLEW
ncbi:hypothetical protein [Celeribacter halophilus]|uniref:hypothetical protein n=1 Tax=Celeribacter halophilus TaxID=576117 RepID=UPI003A950471